MVHILILSVYPMWNVYFLKRYHQNNHGQVSSDKKNYQDTFLLSFTETPPAITTATHTGGLISALSSSNIEYFAKKLHSSFVAT